MYVVCTYLHKSFVCCNGASCMQMGYELLNAWLLYHHRHSYNLNLMQNRESYVRTYVRDCIHTYLHVKF